MEQLFPGYTDVFIDEETCNIRKVYSKQPSTYFYDGKAIIVNLKYVEVKQRYNQARRCNILAAYKKAFGKPFNGSIYASNGEHIYLCNITNGKINAVEFHKFEYMDNPKGYAYGKLKVPHPNNNLAIR